MERIKKLPLFIKIIAAAAVIAAVCYAVGYCYEFSRFLRYKNSIEQLTVSDVDLTQIADGVYQGECDAVYIKVLAEVSVQNHEIVSITLLEHKNDRGAPAEAVVEKMVQQQKVKVDAVASATNSSMVIEKAVENALIKGMK